MQPPHNAPFEAKLKTDSSMVMQFKVGPPAATRPTPPTNAGTCANMAFNAETLARLENAEASENGSHDPGVATRDPCLGSFGASLPLDARVKLRGRVAHSDYVRSNNKEFWI